MQRNLKKKIKIVQTHIAMYKNLFYNLCTLREDNRNAEECDQRKL